jgi:hypothetical protein
MNGAEEEEREKGRNVKSVKTSWAIDQRRRQKEMIARQKVSRCERVNLARKLGDQAADELGDELSDMLACSGTEPEIQLAKPTRKSKKDRRSTAKSDLEAEDGDDLDSSSTSSPMGGRRRGKGGRETKGDDEIYRGQLMMPDWMVAVPERLSECWLVAARPQVC